MVIAVSGRRARAYIYGHRAQRVKFSLFHELVFIRGIENHENGLATRAMCLCATHIAYYKQAKIESTKI